MTKGLSCIFADFDTEQTPDSYNEVTRYSKKKNTYTYLTDDDAKVGDFAVVIANGQFKVVKVIGVIEGSWSSAWKWALATFNLDKIEEQRKREFEIAELKKQLDEKVAAVSEYHKYAQLADMDPSSKEALDRLRELMGGAGMKVINNDQQKSDQ